MKQFYNNILLILNCNKYKWKSDLQKELWINSKLPSDIIYFYVLGNPSLETDYSFDLSENILFVKCDDGYNSLPTKVINAIEAVNNTYEYNYIFKTDDDQMLCNDKFFNVVQIVLKGKKYDYGGKQISVKEHVSKYYTVHSELPKDLLLKEATYSNGRFYFLSTKAVNTLLQYKTDICKHIIEDHAMGYYLLKDKSILSMNIETDNYLIDVPKYVNSKFFIYTECVNCPEIAYTAITSFLKHHSEYVINVYLTKADKEYLDERIFDKKLIRYINYILLDDSISKVYSENGHLGTAIIWSNVINNFRNTNVKCIHFDSDVIFLGDGCNEIIKKLNSSDIVGSKRCYKMNRNNRDDIRYLDDTVATYCFGFNPSKIDIFNDDVLIPMVRGVYNPLNHPILDFFDPITFNILKNKGTIRFINNNILGGFDDTGSRENNNAAINNIFDVGSKIIHFSAIGSGLNYLKLKEKGLETRVPLSYIKAGLKSYAIYNYLILNDDINKIDDPSIYETLIKFKNDFFQK